MISNDADPPGTAPTEFKVTQMYPAGQTPHAGSLSLKMGKPGRYRVAYHPRLAPGGPVLGPFVTHIEVA